MIAKSAFEATHVCCVIAGITASYDNSLYVAHRFPRDVQCLKDRKPMLFYVVHPGFHLV